MTSIEELKKIKKMYGEKFMQMCKRNFPTILNNQGVLLEILQAHFDDASRTLYEDIQNNRLESSFVDFIFEKLNSQKEERVVTDKTPYELFYEAGYVLVECHTEEEIQAFKKYYAEGEELCTFHGGRLDSHVVFWAVKKNVSDIKRKNFKAPERDDEYGTSVMSIQFNKQGTTRVSIKNRYNTSVDNPDATLDNNLDNIAPGLTYSFEQLLQERGLTLDSSQNQFRIPGYVRANDGKYYKYNTRIGNTYYCPGNVIIIDGKPQKLPSPEKRFLIDYFVVDMENKTITMFDPTRKDAFTDGLTDIQKIDIVREKKDGEDIKSLIVYKEGCEEPIIITLDDDDKIIGYRNHELSKVGDGFLAFSRGLRALDTPNIEMLGNNFCQYSSLEELSLPKLKRAGKGCCCCAKKLKKVYVPELIEIDDDGFEGTISLEEIVAPKLKRVRDRFCCDSETLKKVNLESLTEAGDDAFGVAYGLEELNAPALERVGKRFCNNTSLTAINFTALIEAGDELAAMSEKVETVYLPKVKTLGDECFREVKGVKSVRMQNLEKAGSYFFEKAEDAKEITEFEVPKISRIKWFFSSNRHIATLIRRAKKMQRLTRREITRLDAKTPLTPEEVGQVRIIVEDSNVDISKKNVKEEI